MLVVGEAVDPALRRATSNLRSVIDVLPQRGANVYDILRRKKLILTPQSIDYLTKMLSRE